MKKYLVSICIILFLISSCDTEEELLQERLDQAQANDPPKPTIGNADFSSYVSIGNSLTAGFMDGALYSAGQQNSFPSLLARQVNAATNIAFNQPNINSENGFNSSFSNIGEGIIKGKLKINISNPSDPQIEATDGELPNAYEGETSALNNFAVPGILLGQLLTPLTGTPGSALENPFYTRFASSPGSSTILADALSADPSFITLWIGANDVLGFALTGAENESIFTPSSTFEAQYSALISQLSASNAPIIMGNIPDVLSIPYFTLVPYLAIPFDPNDPVDQATVSALNDDSQGFGQYNTQLDNLVLGGFITAEEAESRKVVYEFGVNPILVNDSTLTDLRPFFTGTALEIYSFARPATSTDKFTLPASSLLGTEFAPQLNYGVSYPLGEEYVINATEANEITNRITDFNTTISIAASSNTAFYLWDAAELFNAISINGGIEVNGVMLTNSFGIDGIFSADGIHPNRRGNAIIANEFIDIVNENFDATLNPYPVLDEPSNLFVTQ